MLKLNSSTIFTIILSMFSTIIGAQNIPLPEHPDPIFARADWQNLNGQWSFGFDPDNMGVNEKWQEGTKQLRQKITVPFPWGSALSGIEDLADIGWYERSIVVNPAWQGKRVFVKIGASDWETTAWLDGKQVGNHQGGYVPFEFELTDLITPGKSQSLVIRVDDARRDFTLYGKQGYGNARGIWQTIYLEARPDVFLENIHFSPNIDEEKVNAIAYLSSADDSEHRLSLKINTPSGPLTVEETVPPNTIKYRFNFQVPNQRLWTLDDPLLV